MLDYEALRVIWWLLLGVLLIGFAITDGFDLGVGATFQFLGRTDAERRVLLASIEPFWEGNQVWFILGGGAAFAAWPLLYAASFSSLYLAMFVLLVALILRPVGFGFRNHLTDARWRSIWDNALTLGGAVPALLFGVAFGNLFTGLPFYFDALQRPVYSGGFFNLLHPFALLGGVISLSMLILHGCCYAAMKVGEPMAARASALASFIPGSSKDMVLDVSPGGELHVTITDPDTKLPVTARLLVRGIEGSVDPSFGPDYRASGAGPIIDAHQGDARDDEGAA